MEGPYFLGDTFAVNQQLSDIMATFVASLLEKVGGGRTKGFITGRLFFLLLSRPGSGIRSYKLYRCVPPQGVGGGGGL